MKRCTPFEAVVLLMLIAFILMVVWFGPPMFNSTADDEPAMPSPTPTIAMTVLPESPTPTAQPAGPPMTRTPQAPIVIDLRPTKTPIPTATVTPVPEPAVEPTNTPFPIQKG